MMKLDFRTPPQREVPPLFYVSDEKKITDVAIYQRLTCIAHV